MKVDLLIENGIMVIPKSGLFKGCLGIVGEKIVGIYASPRGISAREKIDARENYILPGWWNPTSIMGIRETWRVISEPRPHPQPCGG